MLKKIDFDKFVLRAKKIHNSKYDYSKTNLRYVTDKIKIICPEHGEFEQTLRAHINFKQGCKICAIFKSRLTQEAFIDRCNQIHNNKYDYSYVKYKNCRTKIKIICPEHGEFEQLAQNHLKGNGCSRCSKEENGLKIKLSNSKFIEKANKIHNFKYDYSLTNYINCSTKVCIICHKHGEFWQVPNTHLNGSGCIKCWSENIDILEKEFLKKANKVHNNKYDYSKINFKNISTKICIICHIHEREFLQSPGAHLRGAGCPVCSESKGELKIRNWLDQHQIKYTTQEWFGRTNNPCKNPKTNKSLFFDFYLSDHRICIEYNGLQHYRSVEYFGGEESFRNLQIRDNLKIKFCKDNNFKLLIIPYTKFNNIEIILKNYFTFNFGQNELNIEYIRSSQI